MQLAEELNIFEGEVRRAIVGGGGWMFGRNNVFEISVMVLVESSDGESVGMSLQGRDRKELVHLTFSNRDIVHARDRDGSIVEPIAIDPLQYSHFDFEWVYR